MKATITRNVAKVVLYTATEPTRPALTHLHVKDGWIESADGFTLARAKVQTNGDGEMFVPRAAFQRAVTMFLDRRARDRFTVEQQDTLLTFIGTTADNEKASLVVAAHDGLEFPDTEKLYPTGKYVSISLQAEYLRRLADMANGTIPEQVQLRIRKNEHNGWPLPVEVAFGEYSVLIMPMMSPNESHMFHAPAPAPVEKPKERTK